MKTTTRDSNIPEMESSAQYAARKAARPRDPLLVWLDGVVRKLTAWWARTA